MVVSEVKTLKCDDLAWLRDKSGLAAGHGCMRSGNSEVRMIFPAASLSGCGAFLSWSK